MTADHCMTNPVCTLSKTLEYTQLNESARYDWCEGCIVHGGASVHEVLNREQATNSGL